MVFGGVVLITMFEKMKNEYAVGKKIHASVKFGFKKCFAFVLDSMALISVIMFSLLFLGTYSIQQIVASGLIGLVCYGLSSLLLGYVFAKLYVDINPTKAIKFGFKREEHIDELK